MYAVYYWYFVDGKPTKRLVYAPNSGEDGYFITEGSFEKGVNIAGNLTIVVPPTNPAWKYYWPDGTEEDPTPILLGQGTLISVDLVQNGVSEELWRGRVISQSWDIYRNMTINCEGTLAYLNDILLPAYNFSWSGIISHAYNPADGLQFANLDALKDFLPNLTGDGITEAITGVIEDVIPSDSFTPDVEEICNTITTGLPIPTTSEDGTVVEDNVDRRISVYDYLLFILTIYNTELTQDPNDRLKQMKIGYIDPVFKTSDYLINHKTDRYTKVWDEISANILEIYGGIMFLSNWYTNANGERVFDDSHSYLYYYKDSVGNASQVIQYGENLVDFEMESDNTERASRFYVFGSVKDQNGKETIVDMSSVNDGLKYFGDPLSLGTISKVEYTELTTPQDCYNRAVQLFRKYYFEKSTTTVTAIDMNLLDHSIEALEPGYKVKVIVDNKAYSLGGGWTREYNFIIESINIDLLSPENSKCVLKRTNA